MIICQQFYLNVRNIEIINRYIFCVFRCFGTLMYFGESTEDCQATCVWDIPASSVH